MVLLWGVLAAFDELNVGLKNNLGFLLVGFTVLAVGLSLGGPSGYAINPARDFGPRLFGALAGTQGLFIGLYWLVPPILMPLIGGALGITLYDILITPGLKTKAAAAAAAAPKASFDTGGAQSVPVTGKKEDTE